MSADLIKQLRRNRELAVNVGKFTFTARRPTDVEAVEMSRNNLELAAIAATYVCGWSGVVEDDIVGGGGQVTVAFDPDLWADWCADRPDFWTPIASAVLDSYTSHRKAMEAVKGN